MASSKNEWRRLALQFDEHRMQALWHLKCMLKDPEAHRAIAEGFVNAPPLSGEEVLKQRIQELASNAKDSKAVALPITSCESCKYVCQPASAEPCNSCLHTPDYRHYAP